jgi:AcrR family transcriptional regulator
MQGNGAAPAPAEAAPAHQRRATRTRNGLTPEQRRQQRREALIDAGLELFGTKGYNATSVEEICRTAYVSTRNFYEEFENREALLWHLVYQTVAEAYDALRRGQPGECGTPPSLSRGLRARIDRMVRAFVDDPRRARLVFLECRGMSLLHEYRRRAAQSAFAALLDEILDDRGVVADVSARSRGTLSLAMVGAFDLVLSDWVLEPERCPVAELVESLIEVASWMGAGAMASATVTVTAPPAAG